MNHHRLRGVASLVVAAGALTAALPLSPAAQAAEPVVAGSAADPSAVGQNVKTVTYQGLSLQVPSSWSVVDLAQAPDTCVRLDRNTVYLGHPGADQNCPTHLIGEKADALVVETFAGAAERADLTTVAVPAGRGVPSLPDSVGQEARVAFEGAGVYVTASHAASSAAAVQRILASAAIEGGATAAPVPVPQSPKAAPGALAAPAASAAASEASSATPSTGYTGKAFDACAAPSSGAMSDWASSPYRGVGIYIGGPTRVCAQNNLTASWVAEQSGAGWHLLPIYAGTQAAGISSSDAEGQGRAAAEAAVNLAQGLGFTSGTVLYVDMEAYAPGYRTNVLNYLSGWTSRLHELNFRSGVYSSSSSGIKDMVAVYNSSGFDRPDVAWSANWNNAADTDDSYIPAGYWSNHQRVHQYAGDVTESYGGTSINIDRNYVDVAAKASVNDPGMTNLTAGDFNGDGKKDLVAVEVSTGKLWLYPGSGSGTLGSRVEIGSGGWNGMSNLAAGDLNGDGKDDIVATEKSTGKLWLYPGTGRGLGDRVEIGSGGWNGMNNSAVGDFNGDGKKDLVASENSTGKLWLYPGNGHGLGDRVEIGTSGWNGMNKIVSPGDMNKDGKDDLVATETSTGKLWLYPGTGRGLGDRVEIGSGGWNGISDYAGADFTGDGIGDLAAVESAPGETGKLYLYKGTGNGLSSRTEIGTGGW
ncbi:glycoside hydrolase domain-containing protein [Kitasatospora sp. NPDC028055]|uniref:glycoside hydrolase domain-containing protein n=1 Tax=Kitasatospora sp. NPDC028055 TaxID=3155653 RepID=UPI0033C47628